MVGSVIRGDGQRAFWVLDERINGVDTARTARSTTTKKRQLWRANLPGIKNVRYQRVSKIKRNVR